MTKKDALVDCPLCGEPSACYRLPINEFHFAYTCLGCGFSTNDLMREGEYDVEEYESVLPELYKEIKQVDSEKRVWYPNVVNIQDKGVVFVSGATVDDWEWSAIKNVKLTEEEKSQPRFREKEWKSDPKTLTDFGKDYLGALEFIGVDL
jgi:hypothetical protein